MNSADIAATFAADDYLYFYGPWPDERNQAEADEISTFLELTAGARVLDAPCGHGRLTGVLASRGMAMTGVDITAGFLERARDDARSIDASPTYVQADLRNLPIADATFDAAFSWFTSFGYFTDEANRQILEEYRRVLRPGGALLIETLHLASLLRRLQPATTITRGDDLMVDATRYDVQTSRIETDRTIVRGGSVRRFHFGVRLHSVPELRALLADVGFPRVTITGRGGEALTTDSHRLVAIARSAL